MGVPAFVMQCLSLKKRAGKPAFCNMPSQNRNRSRVWFDDLPAVAEEESSGRPMAVADDVDGDSDSVCHSVAGDTAGSEPDDSTGEPKADDRYCWPKTPVQGNPERGPSSKYNNEPEVGNMGLMCGNWGTRSTLGGPRTQRRRREIQDRQILRSPGQVLVVVESSRELEALLKQPPVEGSYEKGLEGRSTHEHWVVRGREESAVLVAARKDIANSLVCLIYEVNGDHPYRQRNKAKMATTRTLVCRVSFKQAHWPSWERYRGGRSA